MEDKENEEKGLYVYCLFYSIKYIRIKKDVHECSSSITLVYSDT